MAHADVSTVGVIINPHAGKDIRRLVSGSGPDVRRRQDRHRAPRRGRRPRTGCRAGAAQLRHPPAGGAGGRGPRRADRVRREPADRLAPRHDRCGTVDVEGTGRCDRRARRRRHLPRCRNGLARRAADRDLDRHEQRVPDGARRHDRRCRRRARGDGQRRHRRTSATRPSGSRCASTTPLATPCATTPHSSRRH